MSSQIIEHNGQASKTANKWDDDSNTACLDRYRSGAQGLALRLRSSVRQIIEAVARGLETKASSRL